MDRITITAGLLVALACPASAAAPQCPSEVGSQQHLATAAPGWKDMRSATPHRFKGVTFYDGHPSERVALAPAGIRQERGRDITTWEFGDAVERPIWIECGYSGTSITLARELTSGTRSCTVSSNPKVLVSGLSRIEGMDCK